ncbi:MAG: hypothetical protein ACM31E_01515 [Fibrobacterota bacterium]
MTESRSEMVGAQEIDRHDLSFLIHNISQPSILVHSLRVTCHSSRPIPLTLLNP